MWTNEIQSAITAIASNQLPLFNILKTNKNPLVDLI